MHLCFTASPGECSEGGNTEGFRDRNHLEQGLYQELVWGSRSSLGEMGAEQLDKS